MFHHFGDRVKHWITINEVSIIYSIPESETLCRPEIVLTILSSPLGDRVDVEQPHVVCMTVEGMGKAGVLSDYTPDQVFRTANSLVWAHAQAVSVYRDNYQSHQKGRIGITLVSQFRLSQRNRDWVDAMTQADLEILRTTTACRTSIGPSLSITAKPPSRPLKTLEMQPWDWYVARFIPT